MPVAVESEADNPPKSRPPRRDLLELVIGYFLILATIWTPSPWQRWLYGAAFAWMLAVSCLGREGWAALGLTLRGFVRSFWVVGTAAALAAIALFAASRMHTLHRLHGPTPLLSHAWGYLVWAVMQQFLLQSFFLLRLLRLLGSKPAAVWLAAGLFALAHLPNPVLTPITLLWGALACMLFLRYRNIYTLGLAHGILGLCVAVTVPNFLHHHMRVGLGYVRYHPHMHHRLAGGQRSQIDQSVSTDAWVTAEAPTLRS